MRGCLRVKGGDDGISNRQAKQLANRTKYLKKLILDAIGNDINFAETVTNLLSQKVSIQNLQKGEYVFATDTGVENAYICNLTPALTARKEGQVIRFKVANANTGASTINDGLGIVPLVGGAHAALQGGEMVAGGEAEAQWNSTAGTGSYVLLSCTGAPMQVADATKPKHALSLGQLIGSVSNGNIRIPFNDSGTIRTLIIQFGTTIKVSSAANTFNFSEITFPVAFPNAILKAFVSPVGFGNNSSSTWLKCNSEGETKTGMSIVYSTDSLDVTNSQRINWLAIGY